MIILRIGILIFWNCITALGGWFALPATIPFFNDFVTRVGGAITTVNSYLSYVYFFIDRDAFIYLIALALGLVTFRIALALVNLIIW